MPQVTVKGRYETVLEVPSGTTLYNISQRFQKNFKYPIITALMNNLLTNLSRPVYTDSVVEFFDRTSVEGSDVYARSLEFLVTTCAAQVLDKGVDVLIDYTLDNSIYCEVTNKFITEEDVRRIEIKMREFISQKIPYKFVPTTKEDAMRYFKSTGQIDKVENLRYTSNSTVNLYQIGNHYDYFFGPVVHDTGQTDLFQLIYLDEKGFVINFPRQKHPDDPIRYIHHKKLFEEYRGFQSWNRKVHLALLSDLNKLGTLGKYHDVINLAETHYDDQLSEIAEDISTKIDHIKIVLIAGPSSSGKTTTSKRLRTHLKVRGITIHEISLDDYFVNREDTPKDEDGNYDYASLEAIDLELFNENMQKLFNGEKVLLPKYNFVKGEKEYPGKTLQLAPGDLLLVEGIHTLNDELTKYIPREQKYKIFMNPLTPLKIDNHNRVHATDLRKLRRIVRDNNFRGTSAEETLAIWPNVKKEAEEKIYPYQDEVDMVINSALSYEIGVLKIYAEPLLFAIKEDSPYYSEAHRLISILRNFLPISSELVPKDSVLREFIGGSNIEY